MQWLSSGKDDRAAFRKKVEKALEDVNLRKIKSVGGQLRWLADRTVEQYAQGGQTAMQPNIRSLLEASDEMARRAANTDFAPALELTAGLREICLRLQTAGRAPKADEVALPVLWPAKAWPAKTKAIAAIPFAPPSSRFFIALLRASDSPVQNIRTESNSTPAAAPK